MAYDSFYLKKGLISKLLSLLSFNCSLLHLCSSQLILDCCRAALLRLPHPYATNASSNSSPWPPAMFVHGLLLHSWPLLSLPHATHEVFEEKGSSLRIKLLSLSITARAKAMHYLCRWLDNPWAIVGLDTQSKAMHVAKKLISRCYHQVLRRGHRLRPTSALELRTASVRSCCLKMNNPSGLHHQHPQVLIM